MAQMLGETRGWSAAQGAEVLDYCIPPHHADSPLAEGHPRGKGRRGRAERPEEREMFKVQLGQPQQCHMWIMYPVLSVWYKDKLFSQVVQLKIANNFILFYFIFPHPIEAKDILQAACFGKLLELRQEEHN